MASSCSPLAVPSTSQVISTSPMESSDKGNEYLKDCSASELANALVERFDGNHAKTQDFLKQCLMAVEKQVDSSNNSSSTEEEIDLGDPLLSKAVTLSMISPRGKVELTFYQKYLVAVDPKTSTEAWRVPATQVTQVVVFPKPEECKKPLSKKSSDVVLLNLSDPVTVKSQKKPVSEVSFVLPTELPCWQTPPDVATEDATVAWNEVFRTCFKDAKMLRVHHPEAASPAAFTSYEEDRVSTTGGGMPFVTCYFGTKDGVLFPLTDGSLLFHKPPFLVPASKIEGITTGGRGGGSSRYVDLVVQCQGDETFEFSNVNKDEVQGLQKFMALHATNGDGNSGEDDDAVAEVDEDNDNDEDESSSSAGQKRKRSQRKASALARRVNKRMVNAVDPTEDEEEDADADFVGQNAVEDEEDEDDSDEDSDEEMEPEAGSDDEEEEEDEAEVVVEDEDDGEEEAVAVKNESDETESEG